MTLFKLILDEFNRLFVYIICSYPRYWFTVLCFMEICEFVCRRMLICVSVCVYVCVYVHARMYVCLCVHVRK